MPKNMSDTDLAKEVLDSWEANAIYWDEGIGRDGNLYWRVLEEPCLKRLLADHLKPGCRALDLATGNGLCARWMATYGASVLATDASSQMLERARGHTTTKDQIAFRKLDMADPADFGPLFENSEDKGFDVILMNMAIMDVVTLGPLTEALPKLLNKGGV
jgi:2-polyprenyl-3-methyl-5-hydroxy-6-metoxy-1,4-benzoquinol methylase